MIVLEKGCDILSRTHMCTRMQEIKFGEQVMDSGSAGPKPDVSAAKCEPRAGIGIIVALRPDNRFLHDT